MLDNVTTSSAPAQSLDGLPPLSEMTNQLLHREDLRTLLDALFQKLSGHLRVEKYFNYLLNGDILELQAYSGISPDAAEKIRTLKIGEGICGRVAQTGSPIVLADVQHNEEPYTSLVRSLGIRAHACYPLVADDERIGTLSFATSQRDAFTPDEITLMRALADLVAVALQRQELARRAQQTLRFHQDGEARNRFLAEASRTLASSLDYEATLASVAKLAVPHLADWCTVDLAQENGALRRVATAHVESDHSRWAQQTSQQFPSDPTAPHGIPAVLRSGQPVLVPHLTDEQLITFATSPEHLAFLRQLGLQSLIIVPLIARSRTYGAVTFVSTTLARIYGPADLSLAEDLAGRAALAIDNARLYQEAQAANHAKDHFMAILSHELRTPLTPVMCLLGTLQRRSDLPRDVQEDLHTIQRNVEIEARLIDDLLDLTRIARGKLSLAFEPIDAHVVLAEVCAMCRGEAAEKQIAFSEEFLTDNRYVNADYARLHQIFWNLIKNAIKFTPKGGHISVRATAPSPRQLQVTISDTGIGIEPQNLPTIFDAFEQGGTNIARIFGGLGLGLAITKSLTDLHNGAIHASSAGYGHGSTFTLTLPTITAPVASPHPAHRPDPFAHPRSLRILLIEDHADTSSVMRRILHSFGHNSTLATTVKDALQLAATNEYDLVLSDIGLPDGTGIDFLHNAHFLKPTPAVALTGFGMDDDIRRTRAAGFSAHLIKPVNIEQLEQVLQHLQPGHDG